MTQTEGPEAGTVSDGGEGPGGELSRDSVVGFLVTEASRAEMFLRWTFEWLVDSPMSGVLAAGRTVDNLVKDCTAMIRAREGGAKPLPAVAAQVVQTLDDLKKAFDDRNEVVHSPWWCGGGGEVQAPSRYRQPDLEVVPRSPSDLMRITGDVQRLAGRLLMTMDAYCGDPGWTTTMPGSVLMFDRLREYARRAQARDQDERKGPQGDGLGRPSFDPPGTRPPAAAI